MEGRRISSTFSANSSMSLTGDADAELHFPLPLKSISIESFISSQDLVKVSFYSIAKVTLIENDEIHTYYFKKNAAAENSPSDCMSEMEAVLADYYRLLDPNISPRTFAVHNKEGHFVGVISEEIPNFMPLAKYPLKDEDIDVSFIKEKNLTFGILDELEEKIHNLENESLTLGRHKEYLDKIENDVHIAMKNCVKKINALHISTDELAALGQQFQQIQNKKILWHNKFMLNAKKIQEFYSTLCMTNNEFDRFRTLKGLAIGITSSYINEEDDLHPINISQNGKRIDFDMSFWQLVYKINKKGFISNISRAPGEDYGAVTPGDIQTLPLLRDAKPFYWPTKPGRSTDEAVAVVKNVLGITDNAYSEKLKLVFKKIVTNCVFIHYKFVTLNRYILTNASMYAAIARLHMREETQFQSKLLIEVLGEEQKKRIMIFDSVLYSVPDFISFYLEHGESVFRKFHTQLKDRNEYYSQLSQQVDVRHLKVYHDQLLDLAPVQETYDDINRIVKIKAQQAEEKNSENRTEYRPPDGNYEISFKTIIQTITTEMDDYMSLKLSNGYGYSKTHLEEAKALKTFCEDVDKSPQSYSLKIASIKQELERLRGLILKPGGNFLCKLKLLSELEHIAGLPSKANNLTF
jgi:hypothetical protein